VSEVPIIDSSDDEFERSLNHLSNYQLCDLLNKKEVKVAAAGNSPIYPNRFASSHSR